MLGIPPRQADGAPHRLPADSECVRLTLSRQVQQAGYPQGCAVQLARPIREVGIVAALSQLAFDGVPPWAETRYASVESMSRQGSG